MSKLFFYDVETTGLFYNQNAIHQISGAIVVNGEKKEEFNLFVAPHEDAVIQEEALKVANVTKETIMGYPHHKIIYEMIVAMLGKYCNRYDKLDKFHLVGYNNSHFDNDFFRQFFTINGDKFFGSWFWSDTIDVMVLASDYLINDRPKLPNFQLRTVAKHLGIGVDESKLHDALYDIYLTREIYNIVKHG